MDARIVRQDSRIKLMLGDEHALGEHLRIVARQDRDLDLAKDLARIELVGDEVDGRSRRSVAGSQRRIMRAEPLVFGQKGRVDVEDTAPPALEEVCRNDAHETCQRDQVDLRGVQSRVQRVEEPTLVLRSGRRKTGDRHAFGFREGQSWGIRPVSGHQHNLIGAIGGTARVDERRHVGPASGD
jgi:hypothetical protein